MEEAFEKQFKALIASGRLDGFLKSQGWVKGAEAQTGNHAGEGKGKGAAKKERAKQARAAGKKSTPVQVVEQVPSGWVRMKPKPPTQEEKVPEELLPQGSQRPSGKTLRI